MDARAELLDRVVADVAEHGLTDRSLRDIASAVGTSHRMLLYHFGSRQGLVAAIVQSVEAAQRQLLRELAADTSDPAVLVMALWERVSSPELRPFVRLFFDSLAASAGSDTGRDLTSPWLDEAADISAVAGIDADPVDVRLGIALTRGLLIDVLVTGDVEPATAALRRFLERWQPARTQPAPAVP
jgi:AcrR family transcriptional regulator